MRDHGTFKDIELIRKEEVNKERHFFVIYPDSLFR
jgi:hypothetical protein